MSEEIDFYELSRKTLVKFRKNQKGFSSLEEMVELIESYAQALEDAYHAGHGVGYADGYNEGYHEAETKAAEEAAGESI